MSADRFILPKPIWCIDGSGAIGGWSIRYINSPNLIFEESGKILCEDVVPLRVILLNAVVPQKDGFIYTYEVSLEKVKKVVEEAVKRSVPILSYIGHESTAKLLSQLLGIEIKVNRAEYVPQSKDLAFVFRLKRRLPQPQEVQVTAEDLEVIAVWYL